MPIKSFRGRMKNDTVDRIRLSTTQGKVGYRIHKFQGMPHNGSTDLEAVMKIYKLPQESATTDIDFGDPTLMASMIMIQDDSHENWSEPVVIFDNEVVNQDIYVTLKCHDKSGDANYYVELELMSLNDNQQAVATLKDIRANIN